LPSGVICDREMSALDDKFPGYGFARTRAILTWAHLAALHALGPCVLYRRSFRAVREAAAPGRVDIQV